MMGQVGMADWQMRGAHESKMEGMPGMGGMKGMKGMEGMKEKSVSEARQVAGLTLSFTTVPEIPKAGEVLLRLKVTDQAGKPVTNAQVVFVSTMPVPGMTESKAAASHTKDDVYEGKAMLGMAGMWEVTANVTIPGQPSIAEKFQFAVAGRGM